MLTKETATILTILVTAGCSEWHMLPKDVAATSPKEALVYEQSAGRQLEEPVAHRTPEQARLAYQERVLSRVREFWVPSPEGTSTISCNVRIEQFPDGEVIGATLLDSCGSSEVDSAVIHAIYRASPLPRPRDPSLFDRELNITFSVP